MAVDLVRVSNRSGSPCCCATRWLETVPQGTLTKSPFLDCILLAEGDGFANAAVACAHSE